MAASVDNNHQLPLETAADGGSLSLISGFPTGNFNFGRSDLVNPNAKPDPKIADENISGDGENVEYYRSLIPKGKTETELQILDARDEGTADNWILRNPELIRLTGKHPFNSEAPLTRLVDAGFITPAPLHYVRNHGPVPKASWSDWTVEVCGLVENPTRFTMDQLVNDFPAREFPVTLVCSANRRKEQNMVKQTIGFNWGAGAVSTSLWRGAPLHLVLDQCGVHGGARYVCFEGAEDLPGGGGSEYGTNVRVELAMDPARDMILAYGQNGEFLAPDHGFPVRVIVPGFTGGRMVKWLKRIVVTSEESDSFYYYKDNRFFPSYVDSELANAEGWWYKPESAIYEMNINSAIIAPSHEEVLPINSWTTQKLYTLKGYAFSGGGKKVIRVEVTLDGGDTWKLCNLDHYEKPNKYGKYWCWCFWFLEVEVLDLLNAKEVAVRAWDETLNTQPEKLNWNLMGMMNNCWFRVKANVCKRPKGEIGIVFEHPTVPGNQTGGWMAKEKTLEMSPENNQTRKEIVSAPSMNTSTKYFSIEEVKKHNTADSCWIIVDGHVYECNSYLKDHPGGTDSILINGGTDCTEEFNAIHSDKAKKMLEEYRIGELLHSTDSSHAEKNLMTFTEIEPMQRNIALIPREKIQCKLLKKESLSHDARLFRFALPSEDQVLGLPVGKHIFLCASIDGKLCMRAYTPSSGIEAVGFFDLVVKIYFKGVHPKFPNGGLMSQHLDSLELGSTIDVKGPLGHIEYTGRGSFLVNGKKKTAEKLTMIAGGTGITPIYQVIQAILKDPEDETEMFVVYANRTEDDILLRDELDTWAKDHERRLKVWYVVGSPKEKGWPYSVGYITEAILRRHVPFGSDDVLALACGPPGMIKSAVQPNLEKMGYDIMDRLLVF